MLSSTHLSMLSFKTPFEWNQTIHGSFNQMVMDTTQISWFSIGRPEEVSCIPNVLMLFNINICKRQKNCCLRKMYNILVFLRPPHLSLQDQLLWHCFLLLQPPIEICKLHFHYSFFFFLRNSCKKKLNLIAYALESLLHTDTHTKEQMCTTI